MTLRDEGPPPWPPGRKPPLRWPRRVMIALICAAILAATYVIAARAGSHMSNVPAAPPSTAFSPTP
jgi:hypothetical protein